jgi:hypothetical protein
MRLIRCQIKHVITFLFCFSCSSDIGKKGGNQSVSISRASECVSKGIIMHELLHALGLWHEHTRTDRDNYIEIIYHNVRAGIFILSMLNTYYFHVYLAILTAPYIILEKNSKYVLSE